MVAFFVLGRMFAVDADSARLLTRLANFVDPSAWAWHVGATDGKALFLFMTEIRGLTLAAVFLAAEIWSRRRYPTRRGYHALRRPWCALLLSVLFLVMGFDTGSLLYARI